MKPRTKIIFVIALLAALAAWGLVAYEVSSVLGHISNIESDKEQIVSDESQALTTQSLRKAFLGVGQDSHILDQYFVTATDSPNFIGSIEDLAHSLKLTIVIGSVNIVSANGANSLAMTFSVNGPESAILHFIQLLELLPYAASVPQVALQSVDGGGWRADIQFSVASQ